MTKYFCFLVACYPSIVLNFFQNGGGISHTIPQGVYYVLLNISEFGYEIGLEFCEVLARDVGVGAVRVQVFSEKM